MTKDYIWRTQNSSYVYVDSNSGDDISGLGTMQSPYKTLGKAYRHSETKPANIVCRGIFCEDMADGNHSTTIRGDYPGAAIFDGDNQYSFYGFTYTNLNITNAPAGLFNTSVYTGNALLAGVGRAYNSGAVGHTLAVDLQGLAGSRTIVGRSGLYFGICGGSGSNNAIYYPEPNNSYRLFPFFYNTPHHWSVVGMTKDKRGQSVNKTSISSNGVTYSIFADCAFYASDGIKFTNCYFSNDCTWWDTTGANQFIPTGNTSEEKIESVRQWLTGLGVASNSGIQFIDCIFLDKSTDEIFNNAMMGDLTVKLSAGIPNAYGCFGNALNIDIEDINGLSPSTDARCKWDITTSNGGFAIEDETLKLNLDFHEDSSICTTAIEIDPTKYSLTGMFVEMASHFQSGKLLYDKNVVGENYVAGQELPVGKYIVRGRVVFNGMIMLDQDVITVVEGGANKFEVPDDWYDESIVTELLDPNLDVALYVRSFPNITSVINGPNINLENDKIYVVLETGDLQAILITPGTRENPSVNRKLFRGSIIDGQGGAIVQGSSELRVGCLNPIYSEWVPIQPYDELFISKVGTVYDRDDNGNVLSSGNPNSFSSTYASKLHKNNLTYRYSQLKIVAKNVKSSLPFLVAKN